ncbi:hypothetical protein POTOM_061634 [Populus tomentosa]|uniref:Transmembrane protein n=1 Tax=Populus tomentosa TaxID=118781 RepID=A0A8X7XY13_POPTO|nr:hypothetical protein POTOM_061634 [Populus tomentosa]
MILSCTVLVSPLPTPASEGLDSSYPLSPSYLVAGGPNETSVDSLDGEEFFSSVASVISSVTIDIISWVFNFIAGVQGLVGETLDMCGVPIHDGSLCLLCSYVWERFSPHLLDQLGCSLFHFLTLSLLDMLYFLKLAGILVSMLVVAICSLGAECWLADLSLLVGLLGAIGLLQRFSLPVVGHCLGFVWVRSTVACQDRYGVAVLLLLGTLLLVHTWLWLRVEFTAALKPNRLGEALSPHAWAAGDMWMVSGSIWDGRFKLLVGSCWSLAAHLLGWKASYWVPK